MSKCISHKGEYSEHTFGDDPDMEFVCTYCYVLDEDAIKAELRRLREAVEPAKQYMVDKCYTMYSMNDPAQWVWVAVRDAQTDLNGSSQKRRAIAAEREAARYKAERDFAVAKLRGAMQHMTSYSRELGDSVSLILEGVGIESASATSEPPVDLTR